MSRFTPMTEAEKEELYRTAPELGDYVCRLCGKCRTAEFDPQKVFLLEGGIRPADGRHARAATPRAVRAARTAEAVVRADGGGTQRSTRHCTPKVDPARTTGPSLALCPYGIDIDRKLKIAHEKALRERLHRLKRPRSPGHFAAPAARLPPRLADRVPSLYHHAAEEQHDVP